MLAYPVVITEDDGWFIVESSDFPNVTFVVPNITNARNIKLAKEWEDWKDYVR